MRPDLWKRLVLLLSLVMTLGACQSSAAASPTASPTRSMKGYELYSWQTQGDWAYALVVGTNRLKTFDEIASPDAHVQGLEALKGALDQLPRDEKVFWSTRRVSNTTLPPDEIIDAITVHCGQRGIQLVVEQIQAVSATPTLWSTPHSTATPWPTPTPALVYTPTPYCRPSEAAVHLSASATTLEIGQTLSVTVTLVNGASDVKLGLIQYTLNIQPHGVLISDDLEPIEHPLSLEPGQSDAATFVLRAAAPGVVSLTGSTSFEIHALDYSWASWSGCQSGPLEIIIIPKPL